MGEYGCHRVKGLRGLAGCIKFFRDCAEAYGGEPFRLSVEDCTPALLRALRDLGLGDAQVFLQGTATLAKTDGLTHFRKHRAALTTGTTITYVASQWIDGIEGVAERQIGFDADGTIQLGHGMEVDCVVPADRDSDPIKRAAEAWLKSTAAHIDVDLDAKVTLASPNTWPCEESVEVESRTPGVHIQPRIQGAEIEMRFRDGGGAARFETLLSRDRPTRLVLTAKTTLRHALAPFDKTKVRVDIASLDGDVEVDSTLLGKLAGIDSGKLSIETGLSIGKKDPLAVGMTLRLHVGKASVVISNKWGLLPAHKERIAHALGKSLDEGEAY